MKFVGTPSHQTFRKPLLRGGPKGVAACAGDAIARRTASAKPRRRSGFTLLEVAVATGLFAMIALGVLVGISKAYNLAAQARYRDHARFVLKSISDQFLILQAQDNSGNVKALFQPNTTATGAGLTWQGTSGDSTGLNITLSPSSGTSVPAKVTRKVGYLSSSGQAASTPPASSAGYLLRGDFVVTYTFKGKPYSQSVSLVRAVP